MRGVQRARERKIVRQVSHPIRQHHLHGASQNVVEVSCPKVGESLQLPDGSTTLYLTLGRTARGRLLAIISEGHPDIDKECTILDVEAVQPRKQAAEWFTRSLAERPWQERS